MVAVYEGGDDNADDQASGRIDRESDSSLDAFSQRLDHDRVEVGAGATA
jgi:hypothetical protein